ncbi:MAG: NUDIX hydrolase [Candidatus Methylomirabilales bacterium]
MTRLPSTRRPPVRRQVSAGGVLFRQGTAGPEVALIGLRGGALWGLPKGTVEPGEAPQETAARELAEETGLTGELVEQLGQIEYWFFDRKTQSRVHKTVHFYLFRWTGGDTTRHDHEVDEVRWFPVAEALGVLTHRNEREMVEQAGRLIGGAE